MKRLTFIISLLLLVLGNSWVSAQSVALPSNDRLQLSQSLLNDLEDVYSPADPRLAEPLSQLADQLMTVGRYPEAHRTLDRAMQIVRINEGLYTRAQLPYLKKKIENFANWGDWESARNQLQHIFWLYRTKSTRADRILIDDLSHLSSMHLRGITEDNYEMQSYHFRRAISANWMALAIGEAIWGKQDSRLSPILYSLVKQYHLQAVAIERGGRTGYELRRVSQLSTYVRQFSEVRRYYYFTGLRLLNQMKTIHANAEVPDREGMAMANLYVADWQVLFNRGGEALETYRQAYLELEQAGINSEFIDRYFSRPTVLPEPKFYPTIELALLARTDDVLQSDSETIESSENTLYFTEWGSAFPYVRSPSEESSRQQMDSNFALFSFNLAGVSDIPLWISSRDSTGFSSVQDARLVNTLVESSDEEQLLLQRLQWLRFRPKLDNGLPQEAVATLKYQLAADIPN